MLSNITPAKTSEPVASVRIWTVSPAERAPARRTRRIHPAAALAAGLLHALVLVPILLVHVPPRPEANVALTVELVPEQPAASAAAAADQPPAPPETAQANPPPAPESPASTQAPPKLPPPEPSSPLPSSRPLAEQPAPTLAPDAILPSTPEKPPDEATPAALIPPPPPPPRRENTPRLPARHPLAPRMANPGRQPQSKEMNATPTPVAPPPSAPDPSWQSALAAWLEAHKTYPETAREQNKQGTVALRFTVLQDGRVTDVATVRDSGVAVLDRAATAMLRDAHVPPLPPSLSRDQVTVTVAIRYTLSR